MSFYFNYFSLTSFDIKQVFLTTDKELKIKKMKGHTLSEKYNKTKLNNVKKEERF